MKRPGRQTKKTLILEIARGLGAARFTPAEIEQVRRQLVAQLGPAGKTSAEYIAGVLQHAGQPVVWSTRADTWGRYDEEFRDLLHFATLDEAEMCLVRLDELYRKFNAADEKAATERVLETARRGLRRALMIARNPKVRLRSRVEKEEVARWFTIWLETPDAFFDWLDLRKQSAEFQKTFGRNEESTLGFES